MKSFIVVCVSMFLGLSSAETVAYPRGCIYILGRCYEECPVGTHAYAIGCGYVTHEPTCEKPNPVKDEVMLCDYSSCYCDPPTLRDEKTRKCVLQKDCSPPGPSATLLPPFQNYKPTSETPTPPTPETPAPPTASSSETPAASETPSVPETPVPSDTQSVPETPAPSETSQTANSPTTTTVPEESGDKKE